MRREVTACVCVHIQISHSRIVRTVRKVRIRTVRIHCPDCNSFLAKFGTVKPETLANFGSVRHTSNMYTEVRSAWRWSPYGVIGTWRYNAVEPGGIHVNVLLNQPANSQLTNSDSTPNSFLRRSKSALMNKAKPLTSSFFYLSKTGTNRGNWAQRTKLARNRHLVSRDLGDLVRYMLHRALLLAGTE